MNIKILGLIELERIRGKLEEDLDLFKRGSKFQMFRALMMLEAAIKQNIRSRSGLRVRSGNLLNSILKEVQEDSGIVIGKIGPYNVPYAAVHEFGHNFPARMIKPRYTKALKWVGSNGEDWFSQGHQIPAFRVPARPYLRPALEEQAEAIREKFGLFLAASFDFKE